MTDQQSSPMIVQWLIEHPDNGNQSPFYWGIEESQQGWTSDIRWAFKFDTGDAAELHAAGVGIPDYQIRDHKWLDHKPTSNLDVATGGVTEIVRMLRHFAKGNAGNINSVCAQAADAIDRLSTEAEYERKAVVDLGVILGHAAKLLGVTNWDDIEPAISRLSAETARWKDLHALNLGWEIRARAAEARLAEAVEALRPFVDPNTHSIQTNAKIIDHTLGPLTPLDIIITKAQHEAGRRVVGCSPVGGERS